MQTKTISYILSSYGFVLLFYIIGLILLLILMYKKVVKKIPIYEMVWKLKLLGKTTKKSLKLHERKFVIGITIMLAFCSFIILILSMPLILDFHNLITGDYDAVTCVATTDSNHYKSRYSSEKNIIECENDKEKISVEYVVGDENIKKGTTIYVRYFKHIGIGEVYE